MDTLSESPSMSELCSGVYLHACISPARSLSRSSSLSFATLSRCNASSTPAQASRSMRSSCSPRLPRAAPAGSVSEAAEGRPTPSAGGTKPGGGALMAAGAMRDCRMCASDERIAM